MTRRILSWYIGISAALILIVQCLSLFHAIAEIPLVACMGIAIGVAALFMHPRIRRFHLRSVHLSHVLDPLPIVVPLLAALPIIAVVSLALGWHVPPNNWDSLTYHLSRAAYWRQWHTLAHFPTYSWNQNANPGNAEVLLLVTLLIAHSDALAFLVQFSAYIAATLAIYGLGRQLALKPAYALVGAGLFATMPEVVLQSTSAQNDLTAAAFMTCAVYFMLDAIQQRRWSSFVVMAAALGLAIGTKPTAFLALPGLGIGAIALLRRQEMGHVHVTRQNIVAVGAALFLLCTLGAPWYIADKTDYGSFSGPPIVGNLEKVPALSATILRVNTLRYLIGLVDPEGPVLPTAAASALCGRTAALRSQLADALHVPMSAQGSQVEGYPYNSAPTCFFQEDFSWFGVAGLLAVLAALAIVTAVVFTRRIGPAWTLAAGVTSYLLLFSLLLRWSPFQQRLLITMVALASPLLGLLAQRLWQRRFGRPLAHLLVLYAALTGLVAATNNSGKPLGAWAVDRTTMQTITQPAMGPIFRRIASSVPQSARIGTLLNDGDWDYPIFGQHLDHTIEPLVMSIRPGGRYEIAPSALDYIVTDQPHDSNAAFLRRWRLTGCEVSWTVGTWSLYRCSAHPQHSSVIVSAAPRLSQRRAKP